jgi:hypothetical protein|tara:strand:+ start:67 stop:375 length:309 start_codon:yes stop_codon:yes gene_type:complete
MMVDLASLVIFDPTTATLYAASDLPMVMNGNALQLTLPSSSMPEAPAVPKKKRSRTARTSDKKLSKAFRMANDRYRLKNGQLRKGRSQSDIAKLAQKLRKKM